MTPRRWGLGGKPQGKVDEDDNEGDVTMTVIRVGDFVRLEFGRRVAWIGMTPADAVGLAQLLIKCAGKNGLE
jgi:hypothetical protein